MKILVYLPSRWRLWRAEPEALEALRTRFPSHDLLCPETEERFEAAVGEAEVLLTWHVTPPLLERMPRLRWVQLPFVGIPDELLSWLQAHRHPGIVTTSSGAAAPGLAEQVVGYILAFNRRLPDAWRFQASRHWGATDLWREPDAFPECEGAAAIVVGYGAIGREVARRLLALGMAVRIVRRNAGADPPSPSHLRDDRLAEHGSEALRSLLPGADWIVLAAPLTRETRGMIGRTELALMRPEAGLINVSRGELVDEGALLEALGKGYPRWVALDVFWEEPLPAEHPLWTFPNVLLTPHTGGMSQRFVPRLLQLFADNLARYLSGRPLLNLVDCSRGY